MIRRDIHAADGTPAWLLISQLAHARLSAELAQRWDMRRSPLVEPCRTFVETVRRHDDGWQAWELRPEVHDGRPRDFMEMPLDESLGIWRRSIAVAGTLSPLSAIIVGSHFRHLCRMMLTKHEGKHDWTAAMEHLAEDFLDEQDGLRAEFLAAVDPQHRPEADTAATRGLRLLQFFDYASLWLCCAERTKPETMTGPDGETYTFEPCGPATTEPVPVPVAVAPWPFEAGAFELSVTGRQVPAVVYPSTESLAATSSMEQAIAWQLRPR